MYVCVYIVYVTCTYKIYIALLNVIYSEALSALASMLVNVIMNEYFTLLAKPRTLCGKSHQCRAHAHPWNQPTNSR